MKMWFKKSKEPDKPTEPGSSDGSAGAGVRSINSDPADAPGREDYLPADEGVPAASGSPGAESEEKGPVTVHAADDRPPQAPADTSGQSQRALFKELIEGLYDAVIITDITGHIVNRNSRMTEIFGYAADETWDMPISRLVPGITGVVIARVQQGLAAKRFVMIEGRCTRKDGTSFPAEIAISQISLTNDGNLLFCVRSTERRSASSRQLQTAKRLLDHIPTSAAACGGDGKIVIANAALARMLGHESPAVLVGSPFTIIWREAHAPGVIQRVLEGETVKEAVKVVNTRGKQLQLWVTLAPDYDDSRNVIGFLATFTAASVLSLTGTIPSGDQGV